MATDFLFLETLNLLNRPLVDDEEDHERIRAHKGVSECRVSTRIFRECPMSTSKEECWCRAEVECRVLGWQFWVSVLGDTDIGWMSVSDWKKMGQCQVLEIPPFWALELLDIYGQNLIDHPAKPTKCTFYNYSIYSGRSRPFILCLQRFGIEKNILAHFFLQVYSKIFPRCVKNHLRSGEEDVTCRIGTMLITITGLQLKLDVNLTD